MSENSEYSPETLAKLEKLLARVDELIEPVDTVRFHPGRGKTTVFDSKMGGVPYFPKSMKYPAVREGAYKGKPLFFLAQLNFGTLPKIPEFPTEGILQFFTGCEDDDMLYGMDFKDGFNQNEFRVIYHENIDMNASELYSEKDMPEFGGADDYLPFKGEFLLTAEKAEPMGISADDFRCDKVAAAAYNEVFGGDVEGMSGIWKKVSSKRMRNWSTRSVNRVHVRERVWAAIRSLRRTIRADLTRNTPGARFCCFNRTARTAAQRVLGTTISAGATRALRISL